MKFADLIYVSLQNFKNRKSRVFFTILGVAIAIAVVLSLVSFGYGLQRSLLNQITTADSLLALDIFSPDPEAIKLDDSMLNKVREMRNVEKVIPQATFSGQIAYNNVISEGDINVVEPDIFALDGKSPVAGTFFSEGDSKKVVVTGLTAELFNLDADSILGKTMRFTVYVPKEPGSALVEEVTFGEDYEIVGVVEGRGSGAEVYIQKSDFPHVTINEYAFAKVKVVNEKVIEGVHTELINMGFLVSSLSDVVAQANKIFSIVQLTLGVFGIFALIVAAIGLVNTMTISLLERTNEIGIMRAIGAAPADIRRIFLGESILIGFLGGVTGIVLGIIGSEILNWIFNLLSSSLGGQSVRLFVYPFWFILFIIILSTFVGLAGGIWPARRAANMNPLQALRYK